MIKTNNAAEATSERKTLWRRVKKMYDSFNHGQWEKCFSLIDPKLTEPSKVAFRSYAAQLEAFHLAYGSVRPWEIRIHFHLDASSNKHDSRPFAYVYVIWQDDAHGFHMFKERWVKHRGKWYTRVVGLVPNKQKN